MNWKNGDVQLVTERWSPALAMVLDSTMSDVAEQLHPLVTECHLLRTLLRPPAEADMLSLPTVEREHFRNAAALLKNSVAEGVTVSDCLEAFEVDQVGSEEIDPFLRESWRSPLPRLLEALPDGSDIPDLLVALFSSVSELKDGELLSGLFDRDGLLAALAIAATTRSVVSDGAIDDDAFTSRARFLLGRALTQAARAGLATCDAATLLIVMLQTKDTYTQMVAQRAGIDTRTPQAAAFLSSATSEQQPGAAGLPATKTSLSEELFAVLESALRQALATGRQGIGERELLGRLLASEEPRLRYLVDQVLAVPLPLVEGVLASLPEPDFVEPHLPGSICPVRNASADLAQDRRASPVAREDITAQIAKVFFRKHNRVVLLYGEHGTGSSTMADVMADALLQGRFPALRHTHVVAFDLSGLEGFDYIAAAEKLLSFMDAEPDRIYVVQGLGRYLTENYAQGARRLGHAGYRLLILADLGDYTQLLVGPEPLNNIVDIIELTEPPAAVTAQIVDQAMARLASEYGVTFAAKSGQVAVRMAADYLLATRFPAKAVRLLERAAADVAAEAEMSGQGNPQVDRRALAQRLAANIGLPVETILGTGQDKDYVEMLSTNLVGQEVAVAKVSARLDLIQKGLVDKKAPAAVFVFAGLSGTGKTELAKQIAQIYSQTHAMITFAMENCSEPYSVSKLIGSPPGYVGFDAGGPLINALNRDPYAVVLLDEIEKAHPVVWDPFLNLFDEGTITDSKGVTASGAKAFFVLTSNIGQYEIAAMLARGASPAEIEESVMRMFPAHLHEHARIPCFRPEFVGRVMRRGGIVAFNALSKDALLGITRHGFNQIARQFAEIHGGTFVCDDDVLDMIAETIYAENDAVIRQQRAGYLGARRIQQLLDQHVNNKLAEKIRQIAGAPLVRVVRRANETELVPVYADADVEALISEKRAQLVGRVERRFNLILEAPDDLFAQLSDDKLHRLDRLLAEVGSIV